MRVPLTSGAYQSRSLIAEAQRCVRLYAEKNPPDSPAPFTFYSDPGLRLLATPAAGAGRGAYWANTGALYIVVGPDVYYVSPGWTLTHLGSINTTTGIVSMADNGTTLVLVDGSIDGWQIDLTTNAMTPIAPGTNAPLPLGGGVYAFYGADRVDMLDGFMVFNQPDTRNFYSTYLNQIIFDALYFAAKNGYSDNLVTVIVTKRELWLIGERTTEPWFNAGLPDFPFTIMPGPFIQHGCVAKYSVAQADGVIFFLSQDQSGTKILVRVKGYEAERISNHAFEHAMASYPTVADAEAFCFQIEGHTFYQINFPTADRTWRWDEAAPGMFHEAPWCDTNGVEHRHRAACAASAYGENVCLDWETGKLYALDLNAYTDNGDPILFRRGWPHMMVDGKQVIYPGFTLDMEAATSPATTTVPGPDTIDTGLAAGGEMLQASTSEGLFASPGPNVTNDPLIVGPIIWLRWSDDRGKTFGNPLAQSIGATGEYLVQPQWNRLGRARDRIWEVFGTVPNGRIAISGAFLDPPPIPLDN